jgi:hypothetical protein
MLESLPPEGDSRVRLFSDEARFFVAMVYEVMDLREIAQYHFIT